MPANSKTIKHSVSSINGGVRALPLSHSSVVSYGEMISASISFSNTAVDVQSNVKFSFRLSKDLAVGDKIYCVYLTFEMQHLSIFTTQNVVIPSLYQDLKKMK